MSGSALEFVYISQSVTHRAICIYYMNRTKLNLQLFSEVPLNG